MLICVACVQFERRRNGAGEKQNSGVLNDKSVDARLRNAGNGFRGFFHLVFENEGIEREIAPDPARMQRADGFRQFFHREADFGAGREMFQTEIYGIGSGFNRGPQLRPITGRAHDFRFPGGRSGRHYLSSVARRTTALNARGRLERGFGAL
jgi:hypothetical protein